MTRRIVLGQRYEGEYGLWVSKPGYDAFSTNPSDFLLYMGVLHLHSLITGQIQNVYNTTVTIYHGLGYVPLAVTSIGNKTAQPDNRNTLVWLDTQNMYVETGLVQFTLTYTIFRTMKP